MSAPKYDVEKEIAAIGSCMEAVRGLQKSEAVRVLAYTASFVGVSDLSDRAYALAQGLANQERVDENRPDF